MEALLHAVDAENALHDEQGDPGRTRNQEWAPSKLYTYAIAKYPTSLWQQRNSIQRSAQCQLREPCVLKSTVNTVTSSAFLLDSRHYLDSFCTCYYVNVRVLLQRRVALLLALVASLCASLAPDGRDRGAEGGGTRPRGGPLCSAMHSAPLRRGSSSGAWRGAGRGWRPLEGTARRRVVVHTPPPRLARG